MHPNMYLTNRTFVKLWDVQSKIVSYLGIFIRKARDARSQVRKQSRNLVGGDINWCGGGFFPLS